MKIYTSILYINDVTTFLNTLAGTLDIIYDDLGFDLDSGCNAYKLFSDNQDHLLAFVNLFGGDFVYLA
jgi:hypothetical protein